MGDNKRYTTVLEWKYEAQRLYPDVCAANRQWSSRYATMMARIKTWERLYPLDKVTFLVKEEFRRTRSPGKYQAIADWWLQMQETLDTTC